MTTKEDDQLCPICIEPYNKTARKCVTCLYCDYKACTACAKRLLLEQSEFHCINGDFDFVTQPSPIDPTKTVRVRKFKCGLPFTRKFLVNNFTQVFLNTELRARRQDVLFDIEQTLLPQAQAYAARRKAAIDFNKNKYAIQAKNEPLVCAAKVDVAKLELELCRLKYARINAHTTAEKNKHLKDADEIKRQIDTAVCKTRELERTYTHAPAQDPEPFHYEYNGDGNLNTHKSASASANYTYTARCPRFNTATETGCNGYINDQTHLCGLCGIHVCPQCNAETEVDAAGRTRNHTCNEADKASYEFLRKSAKPCPKCTTIVVKSDGCDHMWCVQCHTHFNWKTGEILKSSSNPEYYEYMRRNGNAIPRAIGDVPGGAECGQDYQVGVNLLNTITDALRATGAPVPGPSRLVGHHRLDIIARAQHIANTSKTTVPTDYFVHYNIVSNIIQFIEHLETQIPRLPDDRRSKLILRAKYLTGELNRNEFKRQSLLFVNKCERITETRNTLRTYRMIIGDILNRYLQHVRNSLADYKKAHGSVANINFAEIEPRILSFNLLNEITSASNVINESLQLIYKCYDYKSTNFIHLNLDGTSNKSEFKPNTRTTRPRKPKVVADTATAIATATATTTAAAHTENIVPPLRRKKRIITVSAPTVINNDHDVDTESDSDSDT